MNFQGDHLFKDIMPFFLVYAVMLLIFALVQQLLATSL